MSSLNLDLSLLITAEEEILESGPSGDAMLDEDGSFIITEDGEYVVQE